MLVLGFVGYFAVLTYTYLFVFEPWEAESLSSLDRYLGTYGFVIVYAAVYRLSLCACEPQAAERTAPVLFSCRVLLPIAALTLLLSLPWKRLPVILSPSRYLSANAELYAERRNVAAEMYDFVSRENSGTIMIVTPRNNTIYDRGMDYEVIPCISKPFYAGDYAEEARSAEFTSRVEEGRYDFIYFAARERAAEDVSKYEIPSEYLPDPSIEGLYFRNRGETRDSMPSELRE